MGIKLNVKDTIAVPTSGGNDFATPPVPDIQRVVIVKTHGGKKLCTEQQRGVVTDKLKLVQNAHDSNNISTHFLLHMHDTWCMWFTFPSLLKARAVIPLSWPP